MRLSCNEVSVGVEKACVAAGYPVGIAVDVAAAGVLLLSVGADGVGAVMRSIDGGMPAVAAPQQSDDVLLFSPANAAAVGMAAAELLTVMPDKRVRFVEVDSPLLLLGLVAVAAVQQRVGFVVSFDGGESGEQFYLPDALFSGVVNKIESAREICLSLANRDSMKRAGQGRAQDGKAPPVPRRLRVAAADWQRLSALAAKTRVVASAESRARGAGAGEIDND